jgi:hypothetical protein
MIASLRIAGVVGGLALLSACDHHVRTEKELSWDCKPDRYYDGLQWVEFHFVENRNYFVTEVGPRLCEELKSLGRPTVVMKFDLLGDSVWGFRGEVLLASMVCQLHSPTAMPERGRRSRA